MPGANGSVRGRGGGTHSAQEYLVVVKMIFSVADVLKKSVLLKTPCKCKTVLLFFCIFPPPKIFLFFSLHSEMLLHWQLINQN